MPQTAMPLTTILRTAFLPGAPVPGTGAPHVAGHVAGAVRIGERVHLSAVNALRPDGTIVGLGDPAAQTHAALDTLEHALQTVGGSLAGVTKLTTCLVDRSDRAEVYGAIAERLPAVHPVSTGLVVAGLSVPGLLVQIDVEAVTTAPERIHRVRTYETDSWYGQGFRWQGSMVSVGANELFVRGQTGSRLDRSGSVGLGRRIEDAGEQAELAMVNLALLLGEAGGSLEDVAKMTVYVSDRAYRDAVYPVIGRHFGAVRPVSTGVVVTGFARPELLFEIDVLAPLRRDGIPHARIRPYHSSAARYGRTGQDLGCELCMAVRAGETIVLRGQTGMGLDEILHGAGDAEAQARQAMDNVEILLGEAGAGLRDVAKATLYVTDRAFLAPAAGAVLDRLRDTNPAFSAMVVKGLASPDLLMEVDITAVFPETSPGPD